VLNLKTALVLGAGGFIGSHMVKRLKSEGYFVRAVDLKFPEFSKSPADEFVLGDLRQHQFMQKILEKPGKGSENFSEIYQFAADMGGAGFVFTGENDADIMHNSATINLNLLDLLISQQSGQEQNRTKVFYSGSACMYPEYNQRDEKNPNCTEDSAYPAAPDSEYGWEKLFSERLYLAYNRNYGIPIAIARYHNIFGPEGTWIGGREKAPAAICRKVIMAENFGEIEIWGDGMQTRSFLYIDECIEATRRLMKHPSFMGPVNIGSEEMVSINDLVRIAAEIEGKKLKIKHINGPLGVRGRNSENTLIRKMLDWDYQLPLNEGIKKTMDWISLQVQNNLIVNSDV
jgi:nucleoside-diphosphate-sugar epimerase